MSEFKYKVGDKVLIKDIDWYNKNKSKTGFISFNDVNFMPEMSRYCGEILTINRVVEVFGQYLMSECGFLWTDGMIECLVERNGKTYPYKIGDRVVLKGNNRCATITDLKYNSWGNLSYYIKIDNDKDISVDYPTDLLLPYDNMIEELVKDECPQDFIEKYCKSCGTQRCDRTKEFLDGCPYYNAYRCKKQNNAMEEETPKFKVNDIVFVKNLGWVRITNGYWDSFANEYIYEVIGFNGEGEYDSINQSNIECQMLPESESENPPTCGNKITLDEYKNNDKEWLFNKLAMLDNITALESIQDIFNHLQQSKYPKTYEECCRVLGVSEFEYNHTGTKMWYRHKLMATLDNLMLCRDAYWKVYGEENGLGKPWEPDYDYNSPPKYVISCYLGDIVKEKYCGQYNRLLSFPTAEMRDAFYENFKEEIEMCKELL